MKEYFATITIEQQNGTNFQRGTINGIFKCETPKDVYDEIFQIALNELTADVSKTIIFNFFVIENNGERK